MLTNDGDTYVSQSATVVANGSRSTVYNKLLVTIASFSSRYCPTIAENNAILDNGNGKNEKHVFYDSSLYRSLRMLLSLCCLKQQNYPSSDPNGLVLSSRSFLRDSVRASFLHWLHKHMAMYLQYMLEDIIYMFTSGDSTQDGGPISSLTAHSTSPISILSDRLRNEMFIVCEIALCHKDNVAVAQRWQQHFVGSVLLHVQQCLNYFSMSVQTTDISSSISTTLQRSTRLVIE